MNRFNKSITIGSVAALAIALSGATFAETKGSAELQREIVSGDVAPGAPAEVKAPVVDKKASEATGKMLKQEAGLLSGDQPGVEHEAGLKPIPKESAETPAEDRAEDKTEKVLRDSNEAIYSPNE